jgi:hypothetical protein
MEGVSLQLVRPRRDALYGASRFGDTVVVKLLLERKVIVDAPNYKQQ